MLQEIYLGQIFACAVFLVIVLVIVGIIVRWRRSAEAAQNRRRIDDLAIQFGTLRLDTERLRAEGTRNRNEIDSQIGELRVEHAKARLREAGACADMAEDRKAAGRKTDSRIVIPHPDLVCRMTRR